MADEIRIVRGDDATIVFDLAGDGGPYDTSSVARAEMTCCDRTATIHALGVTGPGQVTVHIGHEQTQTPGAYRADLQLTGVDGTITTPWLGTLLIVDDVTK